MLRERAKTQLYLVRLYLTDTAPPPPPPPLSLPPLSSLPSLPLSFPYSHISIGICLISLVFSLSPSLPLSPGPSPPPNPNFPLCLSNSLSPFPPLSLPSGLPASLSISLSLSPYHSPYLPSSLFSVPLYPPLTFSHFMSSSLSFFPLFLLFFPLSLSFALLPSFFIPSTITSLYVCLSISPFYAFITSHFCSSPLYFSLLSCLSFFLPLSYSIPPSILSVLSPPPHSLFLSFLSPPSLFLLSFSHLSLYFSLPIFLFICGSPPSFPSHLSHWLSSSLLCSPFSVSPSSFSSTHSSLTLTFLYSLPTFLYLPPYYSRIPLSCAPLTRENQLAALAPRTPNFSDAPLSTACMTDW